MVRLDTVSCEPPRLNFGPVSDPDFVPSTTEHPYGVILNTFASGTWPLTYQWQKRNPASGEWVDLVNDDPCFQSYAPTFDYKAVHSPQLRVGFLSGIWAGEYRCVVSNSCGTLITPPAIVGTGFCAADFNADGGIDFSDVEAFFRAWEHALPIADVNGDGGVDGADIESFFKRWEAGC